MESGSCCVVGVATPSKRTPGANRVLRYQDSNQTAHSREGPRGHVLHRAACLHPRHYAWAPHHLAFQGLLYFSTTSTTVNHVVYYNEGLRGGAAGAARQRGACVVDFKVTVVA